MNRKLLLGLAGTFSIAIGVVSGYWVGGTTGEKEKAVEKKSRPRFSLDAKYSWETPEAFEARRFHYLMAGRYLNTKDMLSKLRGRVTAEDLGDMYELFMHDTTRLGYYDGYMDGGKALPLLCKKWGQVAPVQAMETVKELLREKEFDRDHWEKIFNIKNVLRGWGTTDPLAALQYLEEHPELSLEKEAAVSSVLSGWAESSLPEAWEWALSAGEEEGRKANLNTVFADIIYYHSDKLGEYMSRLTPDDVKLLEGQALDIARSWGQNDPDAAKAWIETLEGPMQEQARTGWLVAIAENDLNSVNAEIESLPEEKRVTAYHRVAIGVLNNSTEDRAGRIRWVLDSVSEQQWDKDMTLKRYAQNWFSENKAQGREWIETLPSDWRRDIMVGQYINSTKFNVNPAEEYARCLDMAGTVNDPVRRDWLTKEVQRQWSAADPVSYKQRMGANP